MNAFVFVAAVALSSTNLNCRATLQNEVRVWTIRIEGAQARPVGSRYDRIAASQRPTQSISSTLTIDRIEIEVRDGNAGERFGIARSTGVMEYTQLTGLDHSGTEGVLANTTGRCMSR
jgi:hypothetical protein